MLGVTLPAVVIGVVVVVLVVDRRHLGVTAKKTKTGVTLSCVTL